MSGAEQPDYKLITSKGNIEIRDYPPMILAEVQVSGERKEAISEGFKILADYIFGNNSSREKIAMTAPVLQQKHEGDWKVRFIMPKQYGVETLSKPNSTAISLIPSPAKRFAAIRFTGLANDAMIKEHTDALREYISTEKLEPIGECVLAFYNPPWTLPFLRRNEVLIEIGTHR